MPFNLSAGTKSGCVSSSVSARANACCVSPCSAMLIARFNCLVGLVKRDSTGRKGACAPADMIAQISKIETHREDRAALKSNCCMTSRANLILGFGASVSNIWFQRSIRFLASFNSPCANTDRSGSTCICARGEFIIDIDRLQAQAIHRLDGSYRPSTARLAPSIPQPEARIVSRIPAYWEPYPALPAVRSSRERHAPC